MTIKLYDIIKIRRSSCTKCTALVYTLPCVVDKILAKYLTNFGEPLYNLDIADYLIIQNKERYSIEAQLGKNKIKFGMPKELENTDWNKTTKKIEFEQALREWLIEILETNIE